MPIGSDKFAFGGSVSNHVAGKDERPGCADCSDVPFDRGSGVPDTPVTGTRPDFRIQGVGKDI